MCKSRASSIKGLLVREYSNYHLFKYEMSEEWSVNDLTVDVSVTSPVPTPELISSTKRAEGRVTPNYNLTLTCVTILPVPGLKYRSEVILETLNMTDILLSFLAQLCL